MTKLRDAVESFLRWYDDSESDLNEAPFRVGTMRAALAAEDEGNIDAAADEFSALAGQYGPVYGWDREDVLSHARAIVAAWRRRDE